MELSMVANFGTKIVTITITKDGNYVLDYFNGEETIRREGTFNEENA